MIKSIIIQAVDCLKNKGSLTEGDLIVLGCSTSEVTGEHIGTASDPELGDQIVNAFINACHLHGLHAAFQCCEHLNRALVMETCTLQARGLTRVSAVPKPYAGGAVAAAAWQQFEKPCLALSVQAEAAVDIGDTLVGMHIKPVAVPIRFNECYLGKAHLVLAYSRPPLIGGARTEYE